MPNSHIENFLEHYIDILDTPKYAVLLKGNWGSGKTWFIENYMKNKVFLTRTDEKGNSLTPGQFAHVSLFGLESAADIDRAIFEALHPILGSKESALITKLLKSSIQNKRLSNMTKELEKKPIFKSRTVEKSFFNILRNTNKNILIFDDIERTSMNGSELFGYINYFVEVLGFKVILLAHEDELLKNFPDYKKLKEKLIGKTFEIQSEFQPALNAFIEKIFNPKAQDFLKISKKIIEDVYFQSKIHNLRVLKNALDEFARIYFMLDSDVVNQADLMKRLLEIYLVLSLEILPGTILPSEIESLFESRFFVSEDENNEEENKQGQKLHVVISKYANIDFHEICLKTHIWVNIFEKGNLTKNKLNTELKKSSYFDRQNKSPIEQLRSYPDYSDEEADMLIKLVLDELPKKQYRSLTKLTEEAGTLFVLGRNGLLPSYSIDELFTMMEAKADDLFDSMSLDKIQKIFQGTDREYVSISYLALDPENEDFNRFISSLSLKQESVLIQKMQQNGLAIFSDKGADNFNLLNFISTPSKISKQTAILTNLGQDLFVEELVNLQGFSQTRLAQYIGSRIDMLSAQPKNPILLQEISFLKEAILRLKVKSELKQGKVSGVVLNRSIRILEAAIKNAEAAI